MKKALTLALAALMLLALCACSVSINVNGSSGEPSAEAADGYTVTLVNGMDGSVYDTYTVAAGEDFVFTISCAAPADMGPAANGEEGSGVTTTSGTITYSNITTGGPNAYPTAETVTISGIDADCTVTVTPNPDETDSVFPTITVGETTGSASGEAFGEASDEASDEASGEASGEPSGEASGEAAEGEYPLFDEYKQYLYDTLMLDSFWQGNEANLVAALETATSPDDESIQNFTGSGMVDQAPAGVVFPMVYADWYAAQ